MSKELVFIEKQDSMSMLHNYLETKEKVCDRKETNMLVYFDELIYEINDSETSDIIYFSKKLCLKVVFFKKVILEE